MKAPDDGLDSLYPDRDPGQGQRRTGSFFRGGELRGLILFAAIMAVGWPIILSYARHKPEPLAPPKVVDNRPLEADKSLAFQGLLDKTPMGFRDNAAYKTLLDRARATPAAELARLARRDVFFTQLWERPDLYRGVPIHLEGTLRRALVHEKVELSPKGRMVEAWFFTPESLRFPYVVMVEDPPPAMPIGADLNERIVVDAYFFRLLGYTAGDTGRAAPLLVGRLGWASADPATGGPADPAARVKSSWSVPVAVVFVSLGIYVALRLAFQVRRVLSPATRRSGSLLNDPTHAALPPEALADWLESAADDDHEHPSGPS